MIDLIETGKNIGKLAEERGISKESISEACNTCLPQVRRWYRGLYLPNIDALCDLSDLFDVPIDEIIVRERK